MFETAYHRAIREGRKVFYEPETQSIIVLPECAHIAFFCRVGKGHRWIAFKDEGVRFSRNRIQFILDVCSGQMMTGEAIAERLESELFGKKRKGR